MGLAGPSCRQKEKMMAFINEYVGKRDIGKYRLIALRNHYYALDRMPPFDEKTETLRWTIDKDRGIWLFYGVMMHKPDHKEGYTGEVYFVLHYKGRNIEVVLEPMGTDRESDPIKRVWKVLRINEKDIEGLDKEEVLKVLQEALEGYGLSGRTDEAYERLGKKRPNVRVELIGEVK